MLSRAILVVTILLGTAPAFAHHSFTAEFDPNKPFKLKGVVTQMEWINPHSWIHLEVKGPDGQPVQWMIECGPPNALLRRGFTKNSLPAGTEIVVEGFLSKDGTNTGNGRDLTFADGRKLFLGNDQGNGGGRGGSAYQVAEVGFCAHGAGGVAIQPFLHALISCLLPPTQGR